MSEDDPGYWAFRQRFPNGDWPIGEYRICACGERFWMRTDEGYVMRPLCDRCLAQEVEARRQRDAREAARRETPA